MDGNAGNQRPVLRPMRQRFQGRIYEQRLIGELNGCRRTPLELRRSLHVRTGPRTGTVRLRAVDRRSLGPALSGCCLGTDVVVLSRSQAMRVRREPECVAYLGSSRRSMQASMLFSISSMRRSSRQDVSGRGRNGL